MPGVEVAIAVGKDGWEMAATEIWAETAATSVMLFQVSALVSL